MNKQEKKQKSDSWQDSLKRSKDLICLGKYSLDITDEDLIVCLPKGRGFYIPLQEVAAVSYSLLGVPGFWAYRSNRDTSEFNLSEDDIDLIVIPEMARAEKIPVRQLLQMLAEDA